MIKKIIKFLALTFYKYLFIGILFVFFGYLIVDYAFFPLLIKNNPMHPFLKTNRTLYLPNVKTMYLNDAINNLNNNNIFNIEVEYIPYDENFNVNEVIDMRPRPYTKIKYDKTIKLYVISYDQEFLLKNYTGKSLRKLELEFDRNNITIDSLVYDFDSDIPNGDILFTIPRSETLITNNDFVIVYVSKGEFKDHYIVPELVNVYGKEAAKTKLQRAGLDLGGYTYDDSNKCDSLNLAPGTVVWQSSTSGQKISVPESINIKICK